MTGRASDSMATSTSGEPRMTVILLRHGRSTSNTAQAPRRPQRWRRPR